MRLFKQLERWKIRRQINQSIIDVVFRLRDRLAYYWQADVNTPQVDFMLLHIACSLGRIERGGCVSPLYPEMLKEIQSAVIFRIVFNSYSTDFKYSTSFKPISLRHPKSKSGCFVISSFFNQTHLMRSSKFRLLARISRVNPFGVSS